MGAVVENEFSFKDLGNLLGASPNTKADLVLPKFDGALKLKGTDQFIYPGEAYSDRDTKSAFHISNLLTKYLDFNNINLKDTADFDFSTTASKLVFVFGSKSNIITRNILTNYSVQEPFTLAYGDKWTIHSKRSGKDYSIDNPAKMSNTNYEAITDYGIISRYSHVPGQDADKTTFVIAGLGSRATEGCGIYFANNWRQLNIKFKNKNIAAVILKFSPIAAENYAVEEWLV